jgi:ABC-type phosphate transport system ATPase subunit
MIFIKPKLNIMNCNIRALKIRTHNNTSVFNTYEHAKKAAEDLNKLDKYFPIFVMPCGKWCAWDPSPDDKTKVAEQKWGDEKQQQLMDNLEVIEQRKLEKQKQNMTDMNALIGKTKAKIDTEKVDHKVRVKDSITQGIKEKDMPKKDKTQVQPQQVSHDSSKLKDKLRAKLEEKRKAESSIQDVTSAQNISQSVDNLTEQVVIEAIENLKRKITVIIISHRLNIVKNCDIIFLLDKGQLIAQGTYRELVQSNKIFEKMAKID